MLAYVDKQGRPVWCVVIQIAVGFLAFINEADVGSTVFTWLLSIGGLGQFITWGSICFSHIRWRRGWIKAGHTLDELPFTSSFGVIGSWIGLVLVSLALIVNFWLSVWPIGSSPDAEVCFENYMCAFIVPPLWLFWKMHTKNWSMYVKAEHMDVDTGRRTYEHLPSHEDPKQMGFGRRLVSAIF
jgi:amino acid transporter